MAVSNRLDLSAEDRTRFASLIFYGLCAALYVFRNADAYINPQFLIEDGTVFFFGARVEGVRAIFQLYAGYLHVIPRLVAAVGNLLPVKSVPLFYAVMALCGCLMTIALILQDRVRLPAKHLLCLVLVLVPHSGEVYAIITNFQWLLPFAALAVLFTDSAPATRYGRVAEAVFIGLFALTGPFAVFLAPVFILKSLMVWRPAWFARWVEWPPYDRPRHQFALTAIVLAGAIVQTGCILGGRAVVVPAMDIAFTHSFLATAVFRSFSSMVFGADIEIGTSPVAYAVSAIALLVVAAGFVRRRDLRFQLFCLVFVSLGVLLTVHVQFKSNIPILYALANGDRYFFISKVIALWMLIISFAGPVFLVVLLMIPLIVLPFFRPPANSFHWRYYAGQLARGYAMDVPFNAGNNVVWTVSFPARTSIGPPRTWDEAGYLASNPDVAQAVANGRLKSGWEHFQRFGKREGRQGGGV